MRAGRWAWWLLAAAAVVALLSWWRAEQRFAAALLAPPPYQLLADQATLARAMARGAGLYQQQCAGCHGADRRGNAARGVPNLVDEHWLFGGEFNTIEQIVYYGIRSGHPKARNLTDMPALGRTGQITADDTRDVIQFLHTLSGRSADPLASERGRALYFGKGACYDCHAGDARGVSDYGSTPLDGSVWLYGGDDQTLFDSIYSGRHGLCPSRSPELSPLEIRSLAVLVHSGNSHDRVQP